ncbi:MAG: AAA family ATPase [Betaproteobacteria bacterium]|nr:AAA family ATPase [Betaproteobacteria bacterium]
MYESFYNLRDKPFQLNPDPRFYFPSQGHKRAFAYLEYGLSQGEGITIITGDVGSGKTLLANSLTRKLAGGDFLTAQLMSHHMAEDDALRSVVAAFGLEAEGLAKSALLKSLEEYLRLAVRQYRRPLLLVDEAQYLDARALEELRMLTNYYEGDRPLLQCILLGHPEFRDVMLSPMMEQLVQRVTTAFHLGPLERIETEQYIKHRLTTAGWSGGTLFSSDAFDVIHEYTAGIPRRINTFCDRALLFGYLEGKRHLDAAAMREVIADIDKERQSGPSTSRTAAGAVLDTNNVDALLALASGVDSQSIEELKERMENLTRTVNRLVPIVRKILFNVSGGKENQ